MAQLPIPKGFLLSFFREEARVLGEIQQMTCPHHATTSTLPATKPAPSATASLSGVPPPEPVLVKPKTTTVHVTGLFSDWLTLGLPANIWVPPPTKLPGNQSQHSCPLCGDVKMSSDGEYNHICLEHLGILLQCCFCTWSSGSACIMQEHILKHHRNSQNSHIRSSSFQS